MAFEKHVPIEMQFKRLTTKINATIAELDHFLMKEDLLVSPVFGEAVQDIPPKDIPIDPFDTPLEDPS